MKVLLLCLTACSRVDEAFEEPTPGTHRMLSVERYDPYESSSFFSDGAAMRTPPAGTIAFGDEAVAIPIDRELVLHGRERFDVFCATCHGVDGSGEGVVAAQMTLRPPPSLHEQRIRAYSREQIERVIEQGYGFMPSYAAELDRRDRVAVAAYTRALVFSRRVPIASLPAGLRTRFEEEVGP